MRTRLGIVLVFAIALLIAGTLVTTARNSAIGEISEPSDPTAAAYIPGTSWAIHAVDGDEANDVGQHVSLAVDPASNVPHISYYDATHGDLRLAKYAGSGGNCGPGDSWSCETVDSGGVGGNVGKYTAIDIYPGSGTATRKLGISYYDARNYALKYAQYGWSPTGFRWIIDTIQIGSHSDGYGLYTSLTFDSAGVPHISYYHADASGDDALMHAHKVVNGSSCNASNSWTCETVDSGDGVGFFTSSGPIDMAAGGRLEIAYYDRGNDELKLATRTGGPGSGCTPANDQWECHRIDSVGGEYASADKDPFDDMHIAYYDPGNGHLRYASYVGSGGLCGPGNTWDCRTVASMGTSSSPMGISLLMDKNDLPLIAYQDMPVGSDPPVLRVARENPALGSSAAADPGYEGSPQIQPPAWLIETVDRGGAHTDVGRFLAVDHDQDGLVTIAYYEWDEATNAGRLKVAWQRNIVFLPLVVR